MQLNKNGWGLQEMLVYCLILFGFLLVAAFMVLRFYGSFEKEFEYKKESKETPKKEVSYQDLEERLISASLLYVENLYSDGIKNDSLTIPVSILVEKSYMNEIHDLKNNDVCNGYALVLDIEGDLKSEAYIKCSNYTSAGYQNWRLD